MNKINFLQKKYVLPLIALPFLIFIAYMINQFKPSEESSNLVEVEELNAQLQDPTSTPTRSCFLHSQTFYITTAYSYGHKYGALQRQRQHT